jgi:hypothetical protein
MGLGQTMLTIMALTLMSRVILSTNTATLDTGYAKDLAEYRITATSLGTSTLEYANALAFDEATADTFVTSTQSNLLTAAASFGPDAGETSSTLYDDVDDYHNYVKVDTIQNSAIFKTTARVEYVSVTTSSMTVTTTKTFVKQITVEVTSDYMRDNTTTPPTADTLRFKTIFSYWYFR